MNVDVDTNRRICLSWRRAAKQQEVVRWTCVRIDKTTTTFCLVNDSGCSTYSSVHCRLQSVSCRSRSSIDQSSVARHCCSPLSPSSALVLNHISSHFLIPVSYSSLICTVSSQWLVILHTIIVLGLHLTFNIHILSIVIHSAYHRPRQFHVCLNSEPWSRQRSRTSRTGRRWTGGW